MNWSELFVQIFMIFVAAYAASVILRYLNRGPK
jgi:hypothetical protein